VPYAELHCHSNFSFLDGASHPEALVAQAARLGLDAIALTDHDGFYGAVRFAEAARELGMPTIFGAELSLELPAPQNGAADPAGEHLLLLARGQEGYTALCRALSAGQLAGRGAEKGRPIYDLDAVAAQTAGRVAALTGCRKGAVPAALTRGGRPAAEREAARLIELFGSEHVAVELTDHGHPGDPARNDALFELAGRLGLPAVASTAAHYAGPEQARTAEAMAAIRARRGLDELEGWLPASGAAFLRSGKEMAARFARYPGAVQAAALLGAECAFELGLLAPGLPPFPVPGGATEAGVLRERTLAGAARCYGPPEAHPAAYRQLEHELAVITERDYPGYFLIVSEIVEFCRDNDILCQGRGSAANSAVCYALGITKVDSVRWNLLFERFLAPERDGYPDIDLDIESDRRDEVIAYVYDTYGRECSAQVATVITYRPRSAVRDAARALGYSPGQQDALSKQVEDRAPPDAPAADLDIPAGVLELAAKLEDSPRHLGIHSGGMVLARAPVAEVCPIEWARMPGRSVVQWDKDDCAAVGLVKFDLLGLGMLSALHYMIDEVAEHEGEEIDLAGLDLDDDEVYAMLRRADAVGVFQVESRAQLGTLPRLAPRTFYDLAVEVALIRPGPIQGGSVHPYLRRRAGQAWEHEHPLLENALERTLGVPLFQEQMMRIAIDVAGFTAGEADALRHAMSSRRSAARLGRLRERFHAGALANGLDEDLAGRIFAQLEAFANFGFPESHALSFAYLVFASAYLKRYHPAAFCAGLLRAQPMGFYSPQSLVADARRHGVTVLGPDVGASLTKTTLEAQPGGDGPAVRIGLAGVRGLGERLAEELVTEREHGGAFTDLADLGSRVRLSRPQAEALATAGALDPLTGDPGGRRAALWAAAAVSRACPGTLPGLAVHPEAPALPGMSKTELAAADAWATGISPDTFPTQFLRGQLEQRGAIPAAELPEIAHGRRILVGGAVTHRQRPATAGGITFLGLEDETGLANVVCTPGLWRRYQRIARSSSALLVRGIVENAHGALTIHADRLEHLSLPVTHTSRDFH
jgi:error-prone DNA polymerase